MFAAAFWTESRRRLVLVRDRLGIKPLYYARARGELYFGSELKAILLHPEIDRRMMRRRSGSLSLAELRAGPAHAGGGNRKASAGPLAGVARRRVSTGQLLAASVPARSATDLEAAKEELDRLLRAAVTEHLVSDVPLGRLVERRPGFVHHSALRLRGIRAEAEDLFDFLPAGGSFDESAYFREVAQPLRDRPS